MWGEPYLWKYCPDQIFRRCVHDSEFNSILTFCHTYACGGHFGTQRTALKVLECGFYWPTIFKDAIVFCMTDRSIFMRLSMLVLMHLRCYFLVILVF